MKIKKNIYKLLCIGIVAITLNSCEKDDYNLPTLTTAAISDITSSSANCGGTISNDGGASIVAKGVCWSTKETPLITDNIAVNGTGIDSFTSIITDLSPNTTYYVRAFATNSKGTGYGNTISFTTLVTITDIEGNIYHTVAIGNQIWMAENLKVTRYNNGDPIPNITDNTQWSELTTGAYCDYDNNPAYSAIYGKLYNYFTIADSRKLCPVGWHIPTEEEWETLINYLGGNDKAGGKLKETGTTHWMSPNINATNEYGFNGLPGGNRSPYGTFQTNGGGAYWWSSTETNFSYAIYYRTNSNSNNTEKLNYLKMMGVSIRCIKD